MRRRQMAGRLGGGLFLALLGASLGCSKTPKFDPPEGPLETVFSELSDESIEVSAIANAKCAPCHRPGGAGPFELLNAQDFQKRRQQVIEVVANGYMPPWPPTPGYNRFEDDRSLSRSEKETLLDWLERGAPSERFNEGLISPRLAPDGWRLGAPDYILKIAEPYKLVADTDEVFRTFVIRAPWDEPVFVRGFDFRPASPRATHHMVLEIDHTGATRELDQSDSNSGFDGLLEGNSSNPVGGQFFGWSPGREPFFTPPGMQWRLDPGVDIVMRLHLQSTGKQERIDPELALYTTNQPPSLFPYLTWLTTGSMEIRADDANHVAVATKAIQRATVLLSVYPHAHYLCKDIMAYVTFPDGRKRWLIRIDEWDFNWQGEYRYATPMRIPAGSEIVARFRYDNSASNAMNPNHPPMPVVDGPRSTDEMGDIWFVSIDATSWKNGAK